MFILALAVLASAVAGPVSDQTSTVFDPVGDTWPGFHAPAFQDIVRARMTKTASGDFELLMEMAGPGPVNPTLPPPGHSHITWAWDFDLDPTAFPQGYPSSPGQAVSPEFIVHVIWDGTEFAGTAVDRRPLLTGGAAIITPVPFSINGTTVEMFLPSTLIGDVPASFHWFSITVDWAGPVGSASHYRVDGTAYSLFNP